MIEKISSVIKGASPRLGSSSSSRLGLAISARPMASICCSPPDMVPAQLFAALAQFRKAAKNFVNPACFFGFAKPQGDRTQLEVLTDVEMAEDFTPLRREGQAEAHHFGGAAAGDVVAI